MMRNKSFDNDRNVMPSLYVRDHGFPNELISKTDMHILLNSTYKLSVDFNDLVCPRTVKNRVRRPSPPRPRNSFILYVKNYAAAVRKEGMRITEISKAASDTWNALSPEVLELFNVLARVAKVRHAMAYPEFKYCPITRRKDIRLVDETTVIVDNVQARVSTTLSTGLSGSMLVHPLQWIDNFDDDTFIAPSEFDDVKHLADGGFGSVYRAIWSRGPPLYDELGRPMEGRQGPTTVALKTLDHMNTVDLLKRIITCRNQKHSPGILNIYGITRHLKSGKYAIVMHYAEHGDLRSYLSNHKDLDWNKRVSLLWGVAVHLRNIHEANLVHKHLHSGNILITGRRHMTYLTDFAIPYDNYVDGIYGVIPYMAPELVYGASHSTASDIYSLGMVMWELSSGEPPFGDHGHDVNLMIRICDGLRPPILEGTPPCWLDLMKSCWDANPNERPSAAEVANTITYWLFGNEKTFEMEFRKC